MARKVKLKNGQTVMAYPHRSYGHFVNAENCTTLYEKDEILSIDGKSFPRGCKKDGQIDWAWIKGKIDPRA